MVGGYEVSADRRQIKSFLLVSSLFILITILMLSIAMDTSSFNQPFLDKASASSVNTPTGNIDSNLSWIENDMGFTFSTQEKLVIGNGRNDGINRIYSADGMLSSSGLIHEFSFNDNRWDEKSIIGDNSDDPTVIQDVSKVYGLGLGDFRNDGVYRVYASGYDLAEYYYDSNSWLGSAKGTSIQWTNDMVLGDARNEGNVRMYVAGWGEIYEVSYNHGDWDSIVIDTGGQQVEELVVTDGRNDGVFRLYAAINEHIYEYTLSGNTWEVVDCGAVGDEYYSLRCDLAGGDGRNDGINRIYLADGGLYELTYSDNSWTIVTIASSKNIKAVTIGTGNDKTNHLYTGSSTGIGEYTFSDGAWKKSSNYETNYEINDLVVGQGRNDGINRVYATANNNHVYEYSYTGKTEVETPTRRNSTFIQEEAGTTTTVSSPQETVFSYLLILVIFGIGIVSGVVGSITSNWILKKRSKKLPSSELFQVANYSTIQSRIKQVSLIIQSPITLGIFIFLVILCILPRSQLDFVVTIVTGIISSVSSSIIFYKWYKKG